MPGLFISFEGGEGSGKTSLGRKLYEELKKRDCNIVWTREPGGCKLSEHIRGSLLKSCGNFIIGREAELLLFLASRVQHIEEKIHPSLEEGKIVLCDRYHDSSIAYQGYARGLGMDYVKKLCSLASHDLWPDLTFYLDLPPEEGILRARGASIENLDRIESESLFFHQKVREGYHMIARENTDRFFWIDAKASEEEVFRQALEKINMLLSENE